MKPSIILYPEAVSNWGFSLVLKDLHRVGSLHFPFRPPIPVSGESGLRALGSIRPFSFVLYWGKLCVLLNLGET